MGKNSLSYIHHSGMNGSEVIGLLCIFNWISDVKLVFKIALLFYILIRTGWTFLFLHTFQPSLDNVWLLNLATLEGGGSHTVWICMSLSTRFNTSCASVSCSLFCEIPFPFVYLPFSHVVELIYASYKCVLILCNEDIFFQCDLAFPLCDP